MREVHHRRTGTWDPVLLSLLQLINAAQCTVFNSVLFNLYRDGSNSLGWHSDDERELGTNPVICGLSLGAPRWMEFKKKGTSVITKVELKAGSLLTMLGSTQIPFLHRIGRSEFSDCRISLTFRSIL